LATLEEISDGSFPAVSRQDIAQFSMQVLLNFFYRSPYAREKARANFYSVFSIFLLKISFFLDKFRWPSETEIIPIHNNIFQDIIRTAHQNVPIPLINLKFCIVRPSASESFLTGSNPVIAQFPQFNLKNFEKIRQQSFYFLAMSPKIGIMFTDQDIEHECVNLAEGSATNLNLQVFKQSTKIISHESNLISDCISACELIVGSKIDT
jgi:hypothetical protein